jgi:hypothetical protein
MFSALNSFQVGGSKPTFVSDVFSTTLYSGNSSTQTITNGINLSVDGGLVWCKPRNSASNHWLFDTNRGVNKYLQSQNTDVEGNLSNSLPAFNFNGFNLGSNGPNVSGVSYASWTFRKAPKFFDVVTWTGNGSSSQTISHNLGSTPACIMVKRTSTAASWFVYHKNSENDGGTLGENGYLVLNAGGNNNYIGTDIWTPTSTTFQANDTYCLANSSGESYVAYLFASNAGGFGFGQLDNIITCGSTNGSKVTLGYEPQWILYKSRDFSEFWQIVDNQRGMPAASPAQLLKPNTSDAETTTSNNITIASDGFTLGAVTGTVIYIAIKAS